MRFALGGYGRSLRIETLEDRSLMSAVPTAGAEVPGVQAWVAAPGDTVVPIHAQLGSTAMELVLGIAEKLDSLESIVNAYLNQVPGWHLTGDIDTTPSYSGMIDGSLIIGANGMLKSASVSLTGSADIAGGIEGYYGVSVLHVGVGAAADLSVNLSATASYSIDTNAWYFGGSASLDGYIKGYGAAMAWPLKGEIYIKGDLTAAAAIDSNSGLASASIAMVGSVGANAQLKSLFGGWTTIASVSHNLASLQYAGTFDVGAWLRSEVNGVAATTQAAKISAISATLAVQADANALDIGATTLSAVNDFGAAAMVDSQTAALAAHADSYVVDGGAAASSRGGSLGEAKSTERDDAVSGRIALLHVSALEQLSTAVVLKDGYWDA